MQNGKLKQAYLSFELNNELFAINAFKVLEVLEQQKLTRIPKAPQHISGIINFRGEVLTIIDTRKLMLMPAREKDDSYVIVVIEMISDGDKMQIGAVMDAVRDVIEIKDAEIRPIPEMGVKYDQKFLSGMLKVDNKFIMIINSEVVFMSEEN